MCTSNVTGHHLSPKRKLWAGVAHAAHLPICGATWQVLLQHCFMLQVFFIFECGIMRSLCAVHVFKVRPSSSTPLATFVPDFVSFATSIAELAYGEKSRTQSITHPASY